MAVYSRFATSDVIVSTNAAQIRMIYVTYAGSINCYLHIFDSASIPASGARPSLSTPLLQASTGFLLTPQPKLRLEFSHGICWAISYFADAYTPAPAEAAWLMINYECIGDLNTRIVTLADGRIARWPFFKLPPGANPALPNLTYTCASANRTVQTADDLVVEGIGIDALPIGKTLSSSLLGLAYDDGVTNLVPTQIGGAGWVSNAIVTADISPAGSACTAVEDDNVTGYETANYNSVTYVTGTYTSSIWIKRYSSTASVCIFRGDGTGSSTDLPCIGTANWRRFTRNFAITAKTKEVLYGT